MELMNSTLSIKEQISQGVIDFMLEPYFPECRYLKEASIEYDQGDSRYNNHPLIRGRFEIPSCFYGNGPGHFNATEFLICFNQMAYVLLADGIEKKLLPELKMNSMEDFKKIQLESSYIARIKDIVFRKAIDPKTFSGYLNIDGVKSMGKNTFYSMSISFKDNEDGNARGSFLIAIVQ